MSNLTDFLHKYTVRLECQHKIPIWIPNFGYIHVGCGKCAVCRKKHSDSWRIRLIHEASQHSNNLFVTFTYSSDHLPYLDGTATFRKRDVQLFFKRLRKDLEKEGIRIKYFLCSEYGPTTFRPHYHCIIFGFPPSLIRLSKIHNYLEKFWTKGFISVSRLNSRRIAYCAKYCVTPCALPSKYYEVKRNKITKKIEGPNLRPFIMCSKGIGSSYLTKRIVDYHRNSLDTTIMVNGYRYSLPRYYKEKIFDDAMKAILLERFIQDQKDYTLWYKENWEHYDRTHEVRKVDEVYQIFCDKVKKKMKKPKFDYVEI